MSRKKLPPQFSRIKGSSMLLFKPTGDDIKEAYERSEKLQIQPNSFTNGVGRMPGFIGEVAFEQLYPEAQYVGEGCFTHDYELGRRTIDVKSLKCTSTPRADYKAAVNCKLDKKLKANTYFFTRVHSSLSHAWVLGWSPASRIISNGRFNKKGETDPDNGFRYKAHCWNFPISLLLRANSLK